jgi:hypothetical protein
MVCHVIGRLGNPTLISLHVTKQNGLDEKKTVLQDVQKAPPARPQRGTKDGPSTLVRQVVL